MLILRLSLWKNYRLCFSSKMKRLGIGSIQCPFVSTNVKQEDNNMAKVTQVSPSFSPVVLELVLEDQKEVNTLYAMINQAPAKHTARLNGENSSSISADVTSFDKISTAIYNVIKNKVAP